MSEGTSITTYSAAYTYCGLLRINDPGHGGCNQLWVSYTDPSTKAGPYWCLCDHTPIPKYADWYSRS